MKACEYDNWQNFVTAIDRAKAAAENIGAGQDNFMDAHKVSGARGPAQKDYHLSRFAAYLVVMNGDPRKPAIAAAQQCEARCVSSLRARRDRFGRASPFRLGRSLLNHDYLLRRIDLDGLRCRVID